MTTETSFLLSKLKDIHTTMVDIGWTEMAEKIKAADKQAANLDSMHDSYVSLAELSVLFKNLSEIQDNEYKEKAFKNVSTTFKRYKNKWIKSSDEVSHYKGVGRSISSIIDEYIETRRSGDW
jgi:hypothetical protein